MEENRPDPELLLKKLKNEEDKKSTQRGRLKIFLGYAAGVGKTYTMLEAAHEAREKGVDVVVGYIEPHARPDTMAMAEGLEQLAPVMKEYKGIKIREFDLDAALRRRPSLLLVDEMAHSNAQGMRHEKRYQDIEELLQAGISVYTTVNIQHLESLNDQVGSITGIRVKERIPDNLLDSADQVEVVDIEPEELIQRLKEGKIYKSEQAERALDHFFAYEKLVALREIALRRVADRVNRIAVMEKENSGKREYYTGEHILTCISPSPTCAKVIRTASRLAYAFHGEFTALYVETPALQEANYKTKKMVEENISLAKALGAKIATVYGEDIAYQIAEYAKLSNVSKLVLGRTNHKIYFGQTKGALTDRVAQYAPNLDIYIIPDIHNEGTDRKDGEQFPRGKAERRPAGQSAGLNWMKSLLVLCTATGIGMLFRHFSMSESNIIMVYLLGVLVIAMCTNRRIYSAFSSICSVLMFNFFFIEPHYSLHMQGKEYPVTFLVMFIIAFVTSSLMNTVHRQARELAKKAYRTEILLDNSRKLRRSKSEQEVVTELAGQIGKLMNLPLLFYIIKNGTLTGPRFFQAKGEGHLGQEEFLSQRERTVAEWTAQNGKRAGTCTHTLPDAKAMYLPVKSNEKVYAVAGIVLEERREIPPFEYSLLTAMLNEAALVFERIELTTIAEKQQ